MPPTRPDTALADAADRLLVESSPPSLVNHCYRTYAFGAALLARQRRRYDDEALFVAAALHDLGLTDRYDDATTPFEERGAQVAYEKMIAEGAQPEFASLVQDAIALHLALATKDDPRPEVAGVNLGAAVDVLGLRLSDLPEGLAGRVLEQYPRHDFKAYLIDVLRSQAERKPMSRIAEYVEKLRFGDLIAAAPFES
jgi:hypothetical protein